MAKNTMFTQLLYYIFLICFQYGCSEQEQLASDYPDLYEDSNTHSANTDVGNTPESMNTDMVDSGTSQNFSDTELIFQSGFESFTRIVDQNSEDARIAGTDENFQDLNDWESDLEQHEKIGYCNIQYQGGNSSQRLAEITTDPVDPTNKALKFWIKESNLDQGGGRIQTNIYNNNNIKELEYSVRLYIPEDFESVKSAPFRVKWLTLMEFWNNANWNGESNQYRMTVNLQKWSKETEALRIGIKSQVRDMVSNRWGDTHVWEYINETFEVPIGKWMQIDLYFLEGDENEGRFKFSVTPEGEDTVVVHDIHNVTHHPEDPNPDGLRHFNPLKLYTSREMIETVSGDGNLLHVFWDDFRLAIDTND